VKQSQHQLLSRHRMNSLQNSLHKKLLLVESSLQNKQPLQNQLLKSMLKKKLPLSIFMREITSNR
jgi:hypothetical protein